MTLVVVGAGLAGLRVAEAAREYGYDGSVIILGAERHQPYDRPPLSKQVLTAGWTDGQTLLTDNVRLSKAGIEVRTSSTVVATTARHVVLEDGETVPFDELVAASGAHARELPGHPRGSRIHYLRILDDSRRLARALASGEDMVVIGAGFIGLEVAAAARLQGVSVTVLESASAPLRGAVGSMVGGWFARLHAGQGVRVLTNTTVTGLHASADRIDVALGSGEHITAGHVVIGIGASPATAWLAGLRLDHSGGVPCDDRGRAASNVWAVGDVAAWFDPIHGDHPWTGHWTAAGKQAEVVGAAVAGHDLAHEPDPAYFWSKQYDLNFQVLGRPDLADETVVLEHGSPDGRGQLAEYRRSGRVVAIAALAAPRKFMALRREWWTFVGRRDSKSPAATWSPPGRPATQA